MAQTHRADELRAAINTVLDILLDGKTERNNFEILASKQGTSVENVALASILTGARVGLLKSAPDADSPQAVVDILRGKFDGFLIRVKNDFPEKR